MNKIIISISLALLVAASFTFYHCQESECLKAKNQKRILCYTPVVNDHVDKSNSESILYGKIYKPNSPEYYSQLIESKSALILYEFSKAINNSQTTENVLTAISWLTLYAKQKGGITAQEQSIFKAAAFESDDKDVRKSALENMISLTADSKDKIPIYKEALYNESKFKRSGSKDITKWARKGLIEHGVICPVKIKIHKVIKNRMKELLRSINIKKSKIKEKK